MWQRTFVATWNKCTNGRWPWRWRWWCCWFSITPWWWRWCWWMWLLFRIFLFVVIVWSWVNIFEFGQWMRYVCKFWQRRHGRCDDCSRFKFIAIIIVVIVTIIIVDWKCINMSLLSLARRRWGWRRQHHGAKFVVKWEIERYDAQNNASSIWLHGLINKRRVGALNMLMVQWNPVKFG